MERSRRETKFFSVIDDVYTQHGTNEIVEIFGDAQVFGFPKPSKLIVKLLNFATEVDDGDIVLDFFAGSGAAGQAVLNLNNQDGGNRKFILVQLPEPCEEDSAPRKAGYKTIAEITKERVRRVINKLNAEGSGKLTYTDAKGNRDWGFRVFKLSESNFRIWNANLVNEQRVLESQ